MKNIFILSAVLLCGGLSHAFATSVDAKTLCSNESEKRLAKLVQKGETRFTEFQFDADSTQVSDVEFTDLGATGSRRHRHKTQIPAKPEYGKMLVMKALGKEKTGWRNLVVKCGVNKGKLATFTYEILTAAETSTTTNTKILPTTASTPGPASVQNP